MTTPEEPSEEQLRAAYEQEIKRLRVEHVVLDGVVTLINLGMRRAGMQPGTEDERDPGQVQVAIEAVRAQLPLIERVAPEQLGPIRDALSQLQLVFVRIGGQAAAPAGGAGPAGGPPDAPGRASPEPGVAAPTAEGSGEGGAETPPPSEPIKPGEPGPAQRSGRLWIPGQ